MCHEENTTEWSFLFRTSWHQQHSRVKRARLQVFESADVFAPFWFASVHEPKPAAADCCCSTTGEIDTQTFGNENLVQEGEYCLDQECKARRRDCSFQDGGAVIEIQPA